MVAPNRAVSAFSTWNHHSDRTSEHLALLQSHLAILIYNADNSSCINILSRANWARHQYLCHTRRGAMTHPYTSLQAAAGEHSPCCCDQWLWWWARSSGDPRRWLGHWGWQMPGCAGPACSMQCSWCPPEAATHTTACHNPAIVRTC